LTEQQSATHLDEVVVPGSIRRCAAVVKGGRRFSFSALVVVGDRNGHVGFGYGKAREVPIAVEKATKAARAHVVSVTLLGATLPHEIIGRCGASKVFMKPAAPGTGVIAGASVRAVLELCGVRDVLTKAYGSTNPVNLVKAAFDGVTRLRSKASVAALRGVEIK
jgi:small subunit ribosomal protein S5